jgi:hypothetical protein
MTTIKHFQSLSRLPFLHFGDDCGVNLSAEVNDLQNSNWFADLPQSSTYFSLLMPLTTFKLKLTDKLKRVVLL